MKQLFQNILAKSGRDLIDFNYFIKFALNDQISWEVLGVFLDDFTSDLSKSKDLNRILLEQLRQFHLILKNNGLFPSSNTKNGSVQNGEEFADDEYEIDEVDFDLPSNDNKDDESHSQNEQMNPDPVVKIFLDSKPEGESNFKKNEFKLKKVAIKVDKSFDKQIYECQSCKEMFVTASALRRHDKAHKKKNQENRSFDCDICGKKVRSKESFLAHVEAHKMQTNQYLTDDENDINEVELATPSDNKKVDQVANEPIHINPVDDDVITDSENQSNLQRNKTKIVVLEKSFNEEIYGCLSCNKMFANATSLRNHERIHKKNNQTVSKTFDCETCGKKSRSKKRFLDHVQAHKIQTSMDQYLTDENMFECIDCLGDFEIVLALKHAKLEHKQSTKKFFKCKLCGKHLKVCALRKHHISHRNQIENEDKNAKPFKCPNCPKRFSCYANRLQHKKIHDSNRQIYQCKLCSKKLTSSLGLKLHEETYCKTLKND